MLPRETRATSDVADDPVHRAFLWWRRFLTSVLQMPSLPLRRGARRSSNGSGRSLRSSPVFASWRRGLSRVLRHTRLVARSLTSGTKVTAIATFELLLHARAPSRAVIGRVTIVALALALAGAGLTALIAPAGQLSRALAAGGLMLVWLSARLAVMWTVFRPRGSGERVLVTASWAAGTVPFIIAIIPVTRALAWGLGAVTAYRVLRHNQPDVKRAGYTVAAGFAVEFVGLLVIIASRNAAVLLRVLSIG